MRTLRRYLGREIASATLFVLLALISLFALFDLINQLNELGKAGYRITHALAFVTLLTPTRAYELLPIAALIGTIFALSKLAADSEFTIMRVAGMSTRRLAVAVMRVGLAFTVAAYLLGELVAPPAEDLAQRFKLRATGAAMAQEFRSGVWVRDVVKGVDGQPSRLRFVNVDHVNPNATIDGWRIFEFDAAFRLRSISTARSGTYEHGAGWLLTDVVETRLPLMGAADGAHDVPGTRILREPQRLWNSDLTPEIFGVLLVQPERMGAFSLSRYIAHLSDNHQRSDRYEIALWKKIFHPAVIMVMMALALPFAYLHVRAGTVSLKIFSGIMIGVLFFALNKLFSHLGLLNTWPPVLIASLPGLVALACALGALYWVERR